jgi:hypothetical protein
MTKEIYHKSIETGEFQLVGFWVNFTHFGLVIYLLFMPLMVLFFHLIDFFQNNPNFFQEGEIWIIVIPPILAALFYWLQKRRLKFCVVKTVLNQVQLKEILISVSKQLNWILGSGTANVYTATTNPGFFSGSWGEQITVLFYEDSVFINSICDPNKKSSVVSWGRSNRNEQSLIDAINEAEHQLD